MNIKAEATIKGTKENIWKVITDIENAPANIKAIESVEILEKPEGTLVGLKWTDTRTLFGKTAKETMWITEAEDYKYYKTRAESHGAIHLSNTYIKEMEGATILGIEFTSKPQTFGAKVMAAILGFMFKNATKKAFLKDLENIREVVEKK